MDTSFSSDLPRYERKFQLSSPQSLALKHMLKLNSAGFSKVYIPRQVNNIYYDTLDFAHFRENLAGVSPRKKVRVRWYGQFDTVEKPVLEIKAKDGEIVTKHARPLNSYSLSELKKFFLETAYPYQPVLKNSYYREYFISASKKVRLTIDSKITFDDMDSSPIHNPTQSLAITIVELKYAINDEDEALIACRHFPFRLVKLSKYEQGISLCYPHLTIL